MNDRRNNSFAIFQLVIKKRAARKNLNKYKLYNVWRDGLFRIL